MQIDISLTGWVRNINLNILSTDTIIINNHTIVRAFSMYQSIRLHAYIHVM